MAPHRLDYTREGNRPPLNSEAQTYQQSLDEIEALKALGERFRIWMALMLLLLGLLALTQARAQQDDVAQMMGRHTPPPVLLGTAKLVSHYNPEQKLRLVLAVKPPHMAEEEQFLEELQTKGSPNFHNFLTAEEWNARFAPSAEDEQKVVDWAKSQGLTVTNRFANRLLVDLEGTSGAIEKAFSVKINNYQVGEEVDFSNDRDPVIPESLAGIVDSVQGLNSMQRMHASLPGEVDAKPVDYIAGPVREAGESSQGDADGSTPPADHMDVHANITNGAYDPTDIYSSQAYDFAALAHLGHCCNPNNHAGGSPRETSIALATFGGFDGNDFKGFTKQYPYLAWNWSVFYIDGKPACCSGETTLDLEYSTATSNSFVSGETTAHVYVYEGGTGGETGVTDMYNHMLSDNLARVFSTSWVCSEVYGCSTASMAARHAIFNQMVGEGWTLVAASGDTGSASDCHTNNPAHLSVTYPSSDPDVVAAGGTRLSLYSTGEYHDEVAWQGNTTPGSCASNHGGSTGGVSAYFAKPSYQSGLSGTKRKVPDLSLNAASGENRYYEGKLAGVGGTSIVSPELAGFFAQANAYLLVVGNHVGATCGSGHACAPMGNPNTYLYYEGFNPKYAPHYPYYDITSGCNSNDATIAAHLKDYCAVAGYDEVTGWGTANMLQLAWAINQWLAGDGGAPTVSFSGVSENHWYGSSAHLKVSVADTTGTKYPKNGVSGFTPKWGADPGDALKEATPGTGNSFYSGPNVVATSASYALSGAGGQGCHTMHVRAWDNAGQGSGDETFGPVCYDSVAPATSHTLTPALNANGWANQTVTVTLSAVDPGSSNGTGSGILLMYDAEDKQTCKPTNLGPCGTYSAPIYVSTEGKHTVQYFSEDKAGNFEALHTLDVNIDKTAPVTSATLSGTSAPTGYAGAVSVELSASDARSGVAATYYAVNGGTTTLYSGPFKVTHVGSNTISFYSVDKAGNTETPHSVSFNEE